MNDQYYNFTLDRVLNKYLNYAVHYLWEDFHVDIEHIDIDTLLKWGATYMKDEHAPRTFAKDYFEDADDAPLQRFKRSLESKKAKTKTTTTTTKTNTNQKENETMAANENTTTKNLNISKKVDVAGMIKVKMAESMMKKDGEVNFGKMMMMDAFDENGQVDFNKMIQAKMMGNFMNSLEKDEDVPLEKLMMLQMLQSGNFDVNQLVMFKMMDKLFKDDEKKETK